jgi:hypothetical protein
MSLSFKHKKVRQFINETLGPSAEYVLHAPVPFQLGYDAGGAADVYPHRRDDEYVHYVTGDLIGCEQGASDAGNYELLIVMPQNEQWGAQLISTLAYATLQSSFNSGETMELGGLGAEHGFEALIFDRYATREIEGTLAGILLVMGITKKELKWSFKNGGTALLEKLKTGKVYPLSLPGRKPVV